MFELILAFGLLLSVFALTLALRAIAPRFHEATIRRTLAHATPKDAGLHNHGIVETYLGYRQ